LRKEKKTGPAAEAPAWDEPFRPTKRWGELADSIPKLSDQIRQAAEQLRRNPPKSDEDIIEIAQSTGHLEARIRGGVRDHSDLDMWVTSETLRPTMRVLCSARNVKQQIENRLGHEKARDLYHDLANALRYVHEPEKPDVEGYYCKASGDYILPGGEVISPATEGKNVFRVIGYVFVGDERRPLHKNYIAEILYTLASGQKKKGTPKPEAAAGEWSKPMSKARMMRILRIDSYHTLNAFAKRHGIQKINRQTFRICLDTLDEETCSKLIDS